MKMVPFIVSGLLLFAALVSGQTLEHKKIVVSSGGGPATFDQYSNRGVVGQVAVGRSSDGEFDQDCGFLGGIADWMTLIYGDERIPVVFELSQNYPNPFNPSTTINYALPEAGHVRLEIYNILGQRTETLIDEFQKAGYHSVIWRAEGVSSGMYFYRIIAGRDSFSRKMLLLK